MDWMLSFALPYWQKALAWWYSLGPVGPWYAWLAGGVIGFLIWLWVSYRFIRHLLGHRKHHGAWFRPNEFEEFLDRLVYREKNGTIPSLIEAKLLDKYRPDRRLHLKKFGDQDFVSW